MQYGKNYPFYFIPPNIVSYDFSEKATLFFKFSVSSVCDSTFDTFVNESSLTIFSRYVCTCTAMFVLFYRTRSHYGSIGFSETLEPLISLTHAEISDVCIMPIV